MKTALAFSGLLLAALAFTGCGKSDETIRLEMAEWAKIDSAHSSEMDFLRELREMDLTLEKTVARHDSLLLKLKKTEADHSGLDLAGAREKVQAAISAMNDVMPTLGQPDYTEMKHEEVVKLLEEQKTNLSAVASQMHEAMDVAKSALKAHADWALSNGKKK